MPKHIATGTAPPTDAPQFLGQHYVDSTNGVMYFAVGTSGVGDWIELISGGGVTNLSTDQDGINVDIISDTGTNIQLQAGTNVTLTETGPNTGIRIDVPTQAGTTNLTFTQPATNVILNSDTGTDVFFAPGTNVQLSSTTTTMTIDVDDTDISFTNVSSTRAEVNSSTSSTPGYINSSGGTTLSVAGGELTINSNPEIRLQSGDSISQESGSTGTTVASAATQTLVTETNFVSGPVEFFGGVVYGGAMTVTLTVDSVEMFSVSVDAVPIPTTGSVDDIAVFVVPPVVATSGYTLEVTNDESVSRTFNCSMFRRATTLGAS